MSTPVKQRGFSVPGAPVKAKLNKPHVGALNVLNFKPQPFRATPMPNFSKMPSTSRGGKTRRNKTRRARRSTRRN